MSTAYEEGFLSKNPETASATAKAEAANPKLMGHARRVNKFALQLVVGRPIRLERDSDGVGPAALARTIHDFEASIILALIGLQTQARSLTRATLESACICTAACRDLRNEEGNSLAVEALDAGHDKFRRDFMKGLAKVPEITEEKATLLAAAVAEIDAGEKLKTASVKALMKSVGLEHLYTILYRPLSQDVHLTTTSITQHMRRREYGSIEGFRLGPVYDLLKDTVTDACLALILAADSYAQRFGYPADLEALAQLGKEHMALVEDAELDAMVHPEVHSGVTLDSPEHE